MECISVFDMLKIGIGPSSSHTLGPWRAAERWIKELKDNNKFDNVEKISVDLYGSLSLTGKGHATDYAIILGLSGADPETIPTETISSTISEIKKTNIILFNGEKEIVFHPESDIVFNYTNLLAYNSVKNMWETTVDDIKKYHGYSSGNNYPALYVYTFPPPLTAVFPSIDVPLYRFRMSLEAEL